MKALVISSEWGTREPHSLSFCIFVDSQVTNESESDDKGFEDLTRWLLSLRSSLSVCGVVYIAS
jgi:hypothetical protein